MLTGENGIVRQAIESKDNTRGASAKEEIDIWKSNVKMDNLTGSLTAEEEQDLLDRLVENGTLKQEEANKLKDGETIKIGKSEISLDETILPLPENAVLSQIPGEYEKVENGKVIYIMKDADGDGVIDIPDWTDIEKMRTTYDQFVWVPVQNAVAKDDTDLAKKNENGIYPMAVEIEGIDSNGLQNYRGVLYDFSEEIDTEGEKYVKITAKKYSATSGIREPAYLTNTSYGDATAYNTVGLTQDLLQQEYNKMVDKVKKKKGFWVGRYETSNMVGTPTTNYDDELNKSVEANTTNRVTVIKGTTIGISTNESIPNFLNWYRMYEQQKNYSKLALGSTATMTSGIIWGSQWDQIMIWMKEIENIRVPAYGKYFVTNSVGYGNYGNISGAEEYDTATSEIEPATTGSSENFKVKNVYDLAGNVLDWSLEGLGYIGRMLKGACFDCTDSSKAKASMLDNNMPIGGSIHLGSRITLY